MEQPGPDIRGYADAGVLHFEAHELPGLVLIDRFSPQHDAVALAELRRIAGEVEQRLLAAYRENSAAAPETTIWGRQSGLPLVEGFLAFTQGDSAGAVARLHPARYVANSFGGGHAQRDVIDWTLSEAARRGDMRGVAQALTHERLALKPHSPVNLSFLQRASAMQGPVAAPR